MITKTLLAATLLLTSACQTGELASSDAAPEAVLALEPATVEREVPEPKTCGACNGFFLGFRSCCTHTVECWPEPCHLVTVCEWEVCTGVLPPHT